MVLVAPGRIMPCKGYMHILVHAGTLMIHVARTSIEHVQRHWQIMPGAQNGNLGIPGDTHRIPAGYPEKKEEEEIGG